MEKNFATLPVQWKSRVSPNIRIHGLQHVGKLHLIDYLGSGLVDPRLWTVSSALHLIQCICMTWLWKQKPAQTNVPKCNIVAVLGLQQLLSTAFAWKYWKSETLLLFPSRNSIPIEVKLSEALSNSVKTLDITLTLALFAHWNRRLAKSADSQRSCFAQLAASCVGTQRFKMERNAVKWNESLFVRSEAVA